MKKLNGEQIFSAMSGIDPRLLAEALPPSWVNTDATPQKKRRRPFAWLDSGWAAAILSVVVAAGVLAAVIAAGRMGSADNPLPGTTPATDTRTDTQTDTQAPPPVEDDQPYSLSFAPYGDGMAAAITVNDRLSSLYDVVIPEKSPDGKTVTALENTFNAHMLLPEVMTADFFQRYIQAPMEAYFGITYEEACDMQTDSEYSLDEPGFALRRYLAFFSRRTPQEIGSELSIGTLNTDIYLLEPTMGKDEQRELHDLLVKLDFTAKQWQTANAELARHASSPEEILTDINLSAGIRTVTLPATLREMDAAMFDRFIDLEKIIYGGTVEEWVSLTGGEWECLVRVECTDGVIRPEWDVDMVVDTTPPYLTAPDASPIITDTNIALNFSDELIYISGEMLSYAYLENGELVGADAAGLSFEDYVASMPVQTVTVPYRKNPSIHYLYHEYQSISWSMTVYDESLSPVSEQETASIRNQLPLRVLSRGTYYVELLILWEGPRIPELDDNEHYTARFIFRMHVESTRAETETETERETETEPFVPETDPKVNSTRVAVDVQGRESVYVEGYYLYGSSIMEHADGSSSIASFSAEVPPPAEQIAEGVPTVVLPQGTSLTFRHKKTEGWSYALDMDIYNADVRLTASCDPNAFAELSLSPGIYYVELGVRSSGPYIPEADGNENYGVYFTFCLEVIEPSTELE